MYLKRYEGKMLKAYSYPGPAQTLYLLPGPLMLHFPCYLEQTRANKLKYVHRTIIFLALPAAQQLLHSIISNCSDKVRAY
jgi:hypothetical protein